MAEASNVRTAAEIESAVRESIGESHQDPRERRNVNEVQQDLVWLGPVPEPTQKPTSAPKTRQVASASDTTPATVAAATRPTEIADSLSSMQQESARVSEDPFQKAFQAVRNGIGVPMSVGDAVREVQGEVPVSNATISGYQEEPQVMSKRQPAVLPNGDVTVTVPSATTTVVAENAPAEDAADTKVEPVIKDSVRQAAETLAAPFYNDVQGPPSNYRENRVENRPGSVFNNRASGWNGGKKLDFKPLSTRRLNESLVKSVKNWMKNAFSDKGIGFRIYAKMIPMTTLDLREVGVGVDEIIAAIDQNYDMVESLFYQHMSEEDKATPLDQWSVSRVIDFVNSNDIYVATFKPPNNRGQDIQRRILRVCTNERRGIYIHPAMAATYTADFDGDDMEVSLDPQTVGIARDPMSYMVGPDGKISLDIKFLPVSPIKGGYEDGKSASDYVREIMLANFSHIHGPQMDAFVDAILKLGDTAKSGSTEQEEAYAEVFRKASELAYWATASTTGDPRLIKTYERMMSQLCKAVYDGMQMLRVEDALATVGVSSIPGMPEPVTYSDNAILKILDGIIDGAVPNNFQALKVALNGYLGNAEGKNAPFRFSADIGKILKFDSRLQIGSGELGTIDKNGDFVVDPNNDNHMTMLFESTMKFAESRIMAKEIKKAGRVEYYSQLLREKVIRDVGFYEDLKKDGTRRYTDYVSYLDAFVASYSRTAALINEANLIWLANMSIASNSNRKLVSPLTKKDKDWTTDDIAEAMLTVYGSFSVEHMFGELTRSNGSRRPVMSSESVEDVFWFGNPNAVREAKGSRGATYDPRKSFETGMRTNDRNTVESLWVNGKYLPYNLRKFSHEHRLNKYKGPKTFSSLRGNPVKAQFTMLMSIADKRTSTASSYCIKTYGGVNLKDDKKRDNYAEEPTISMLSTLMQSFNRLDSDKDLSGRPDQLLWMEDIIKVMTDIGPDMFYHFGMDSLAGFAKSELGLAMSKAADNPGVLGGIYAAMVFRWRMRYVTDLVNQISKFDQGDDRSLIDDVNKLKLAIDELADSSETWHGIIRELTEDSVGNSAFKMMVENNVRLTVRGTDEEYDWNQDVSRKADGFWRNPGNHTSLRDVIEDLTLDSDTKFAVITDIVQYWEQDAFLTTYEVAYQLENGNDSAYALGSTGRRGALSARDDFKSSFTRWGKTCQEKMQKDIEVARKHHAESSGDLTNTLKYLDESPWAMVAIDDGMYANALMSVKDKTYAQTEKASQHPWTNALYQALAFQHNGGHMNDVTRTDDRLLGIQSVEAVDIADVIHILADPSARMYVYDDTGRYGMVTRDLLLSAALGREFDERNVTEADIWEFLEMSPRIASAIRQHNACVMPDSDGTGYIGATTSIDETMNNMSGARHDVIGHVKYLMRDHPVYAGIISLASKSPTNTHGQTVDSVSRNERRRVMAIEDYLSHRIYAAASLGASSEQTAIEILSDLGITRDSLIDALLPDYDKFLDFLDLPPVSDAYGESVRDAMFTYDVVTKNLAAYINQVKGSVPLGVEAGPMPSRPSFVGVDTVSIASFWDVVQELGGAKTAVSTGVEGSETYKYGLWASSITARDKYANLAAVLDDIDQSWDGMWLNVTNHDQTNAVLSVSPDGTPSIIVTEVDVVNNERVIVTKTYGVDDLEELCNKQKINEIVVSTPDGYTVRDRSTDSYGTPLSSLSLYMVSKRSNGAEKFNLKAKKAGYDGSDSIIKMQGKYRMVDDKSDQEGKRKKRVEFLEMLDELREAAQDAGSINGAKIALAKQMLSENLALGYDDLTLSNYMSLADLMVIEGEDGKVYVRSLEMLFSATKWRTGEAVAGMTNKQRREAFDAIVNDNSLETGVGISMMTDVMSAFDRVAPHSQSSSIDGMRLNSSGFERNYDLLRQMANEEYRRQKSNGIERPEVTIRQQEAEALNRRFMGIWKKGGKKLYKGVDGVMSVLERVKTVRSHNVIGFAGGLGAKPELHYAIGPSNLIVVGDGSTSDQEVRDICINARRYGMTVLVSYKNIDKIPRDLFGDAIVCSESGDALIPFFDMRLNGSEAYPYTGSRFAIQQIPYSRYVFSVEDSINQYGLGDAQYRPLRALLNRLRLIATGSTRLTAESLFPNVFGNSDFSEGCSMSFSMASPGEIDALIVQDGVHCTIDYGIVEGARGFDQRMHDVNNAIERFRKAGVGDDGWVTGEVHPGDIVAWARCEIYDHRTNRQSYVFAPLIPFPLHGAKRQPESFTVENLGPGDRAGSFFDIDWRNTSSLANSFLKYFDSTGGANKGMVNFADVIDDVLTLADGTPIDLFCAKASTDSRKIGTDRRIKTMITLITLARMHGYNFAESQDAFPDNPELRQRMLGERIPQSEWAAMLSNGVRFCSDDNVNAFLNWECRKILANDGNPWDYLANRYVNENGETIDTHVMWEFESMFDQGVNYEDGLLRFLHHMDPTFCPNGIEDANENYLFRLQKDGGQIASDFNRGVLQMLVPHRNSRGDIVYIWDNVYAGLSFFGEDYSGFSRPNVDGSSKFLDGTNTAAFYGAELSKSDDKLRAEWAVSDIAKMPRDAGAFGI